MLDRAALVPAWVFRWPLLLLLLALSLLVISAPASAQETGGSFGGGGFGGSGHGSGSSWGGSSSSSGWHDSSHSTSRHSSGGGGGSFEGFLVGVAALVVVGFMSVIFGGLRRTFTQPQSYETPIRYVPRAGSTWETMDVSVLVLAIDWRARRIVQEALMHMARFGDTKSKEGLAGLLRETVKSVRSVELAWLYSGAYNASPMAPGAAELAFRKAAADARARFKRELVRAADGVKLEESAPAMRARAQEGQGVVVVTVVVAARRELMDVTSVRDADQMREALDGLARLSPQDLVALEVIWSPAAEDDRMSTAELEMLYPELKKIDESSIAGRVFCDHCGGPFAAEIGQCPHCGAPYRTSREQSR